jgi:maleylpyruvate isomerase
VTEHDVDRAAVERDIASCSASQAALVADLTTRSQMDPGAPSRLPGWSLGHVLSHIARNGDSQLEMLAGRPQYPSVDARNADIEEGAGREWAVLAADVAGSAAAVDQAFSSQSDWSGTARTVGGERPIAMLPLLRQREVEVHRVDLGFGYSFADMPADYVRRDLRLMAIMWSARKPMGMTSLPDDALAVDPPTRLAWLMGRADIGGLAAAGLF